MNDKVKEIREKLFKDLDAKARLVADVKHELASIRYGCDDDSEAIETIQKVNRRLQELHRLVGSMIEEGKSAHYRAKLVIQSEAVSSAGADCARKA